MVSLPLPPPNRPVTPLFLDIPAGEKLVRIFDPTRRSATALTFRANAPRKRFDHRLIYRNAHNDEPAVVLYERARPALVCPGDAVIRLDHPALRPLLLDIMRRNNLAYDS